MLTNISRKCFINDIGSLGQSSFSAKRTNGVSYSFTSANGLNAWRSGTFKTFLSGSAGSTIGSTFIYGTGNTPVTADDYCLASPITIQSGYTNRSATITTDTMNFKITATMVVEWSGAETTISEIGMYYGFQDYGWLLAREVLDSPITVNNGDTFTVSMVIG